ncbi:hypothetical protein TTHERM_00723240 (macronuclear) [Tetrahymena thermophila SB210]|uniref:Uncharacterized protein n=1 Tax=Tetrahymena thermophila (strain SB210) TaxID=312017 RepID=I7MFQ8_TETTS|nr:hypothetical protein TTHERM_00723240 [Tetrahymena thermophila SB210]EAR84139.1 hypothetical protein TTHERM_00723240 [Tetrahymena thermophila SB210]|eukprot:XP_001031802.1 hypothetical protein TTHERM_00723240 [Tetrahymena thermophila SB210]
MLKNIQDNNTMISPQPLLTKNQLYTNSSNSNLTSNSNSEPSFFNTSKQTTQSYQQVGSQQKNYEKPSILIASEVNSQQAIGAILDLKQSAKSIGDTLIYIFSQFIDHISSTGTSVDFDFIKSQWNMLKTHLQPFNQQKITEYFKQTNNSSRNQSYHSSYRNLSEQVSNIDSNLNLMNYNNDTSLDTAIPPKSMPTSTRNKQQSANTQNPQENVSNPNEMAKAFITVQNTNTSHKPNLFLNNCQSPSAPSLIPQTISSHTPPPVNTSQYQIQSQNCVKSVSSQPLISNLLQYNQGCRDDAISPSYTITSVSRCNSFTTTNYPQVSNFEISTAFNNINQNNDTNTCTSIQNNQFQNEVKKENMQGQPLLQQQTISITSRSKKDGNWSQYKAVPISTFKLDVPRMNKHMHQNSQNNSQGIQSQTSIVCNENELQQQVSDLSQTPVTQNQPNSTFKRGNSQYEKRMQSSQTNFQQHHTFLQQQRESLARQTSQSQEKSSITKLMYDSKSQTLVQVNSSDSHRQNLQINEFNQQKVQNNNQISPKQIKKQQLQQLSQQSLTSNQNLNSNFSSINFLTNPINQSQQNQGISVHSSSSLSQKAFNQILQQQQISAITSSTHQNIQNKPLQGITLLANNSLNQQLQSSQRAQLNQSNSKTIVNNSQNTYTNLHSSQEESTKENDRYAYYVSKENEISKENLDNKFFESTKINQSAGKVYQKSSQSKVINLNSYQVPSQYGQKQNFENCISPIKGQQQSKSFNTKHLFQSPTISIQSLNGRGVNADSNYGKTSYRMKTESDAKVKSGSTTEQILSTQATNDRIQDLNNLTGVQSQRSNIKYTLSSQTSIPSSTQIPGQQEVVNFQANQLKSKILNLISVYQENNQIINSLSFK